LQNFYISQVCRIRQDRFQFEEWQIFWSDRP